MSDMVFHIIKAAEAAPEGVKTGNLTKYVKDHTPLTDADIDALLDLPGPVDKGKLSAAIRAAEVRNEVSTGGQTEGERPEAESGDGDEAAAETEGSATD